MKPVDLVGAAPWDNVFFTTYALSLSFFEVEVLDALVRGGGRGAVIYSDVDGIQYALSERGARLVGREYELIPVSNSRGVFHPKVSVLAQGTDAHLLVGSGNLTFGGWGANLEFIEHLHSSFAATAMSEAADMLELLADTPHISMADPEPCLRTAEVLRASTRGQAENRDIRLVHNVAGTVGERIAELADELGGAARVVLVSPYFDQTGSGIDRLLAALNCSEAHVHRHGATCAAGSAASWPSMDPTKVRAIKLQADLVDDDRPLHGKCLEILCRDGRLLVSGSANSTLAGLYGANAEASIVRIERDRTRAFAFQECAPPPPSIFTDDREDGDIDRDYTLFARLEGVVIRGSILASWPAGDANLHWEVSGKEEFLGEVTVDGDGSFSIASDQITDETWRAGRIVLCARKDSYVARGFVLLPALFSLSKRAGALGPRIFAMLGGTESPDDVAAILSYFHEDPSRIPSQMADQSRGEGGSNEAPDEVVSAFMLKSADGGGLHREESHPHSILGSEHAFAALRTAFRSMRGPLTENEREGNSSQGNGDGPDGEDEQRNQRRREKTIDAFSDFLDVALDPDHNGRHAHLSLLLLHYLTDRLQPPIEQIRGWLHAILLQMPKTLDPEAGVDVLCARLVSICGTANADVIVKARAYLKSRGLLDVTLPTDAFPLPALNAVLCPEGDIEATIETIREARTHLEEIEDLRCNGASAERQPLLNKSPFWSSFVDAAAHEDGFEARVYFVPETETACPKHYIRLPAGRLQDLSDLGFSRTECCSRLMIVGGAHGD